MTDVVPKIETQAPRTGSFPLRGLLFLGLAALVVIGDQLTKRVAEDRLRSERSVPVVDDLLRLTYVQNRGAGSAHGSHGWHGSLSMTRSGCLVR